MNPMSPKKEPADWTRTSRYLCKILRHEPKIAGIALDRHGWANVQELLAGIQGTHPLTMEQLEEIVRTDAKGRYSFNEDKTLIRANQGHSIPVDVEMEELPPPEFLFHGTAEKFAGSIERNGILAKGRLYVHLSRDADTARQVGLRHGKPVVYQVRAGAMQRDGFRFYRSVNGVWLVHYVPVNYLVRQA